MADAHPGWPGSVWDEGDPAPTGTLVVVKGPRGCEDEDRSGRVLGAWGEIFPDCPHDNAMYHRFAVVFEDGSIDCVFPPRCVPVEIDREGTEEIDG